MQFAMQADWDEYQLIRQASMSGRLSFEFERDPKTGSITFTATRYTAAKLARQLERIVDFGASTAKEVLGIDKIS